MSLYKFISVDDDDFNNSLCKLLIRRTLKISEVNTFTEGEKALEYLITSFKKMGEQEVTVLFLDINMPNMDGWEFLEYFNKLDSTIKTKHTFVYYHPLSIRAIKKRPKRIQMCFDILLSHYQAKPCLN